MERQGKGPLGGQKLCHMCSNQPRYSKCLRLLTNCHHVDDKYFQNYSRRNIRFGPTCSILWLRNISMTLLAYAISGFDIPEIDH